MSTQPSLSQLAAALDYQANALWLMAESQYNQMSTIARKLEKIMGQVQLDDTVLTSASNALESLSGVTEKLVTAVEGFLSSPAAQQLPQANLDALHAAVADASTAQNDALSAQQAIASVTPPPATP